jgi:hypothetical protein
MPHPATAEDGADRSCRGPRCAQWPTAAVHWRLPRRGRGRRPPRPPQQRTSPTWRRCAWCPSRRRRRPISLAAASEPDEIMLGTRLLFCVLCRDLIAFCFVSRDLIAFYFYRAWLNSYGTPNRILTQLGSAHTTYQTQHRKTHLYLVNLAELSLYDLR